MSNTWPGGHRHAMDQSAHEAWNARNDPGTRQLCVECESETGRCEEDSIYVGDCGPLCAKCGQKLSSDLDEPEPEPLCPTCDGTKRVPEPNVIVVDRGTKWQRSYSEIVNIECPDCFN